MAAVALTLIWLNTYTLYVYDALLFIASAYALYEMASAFGKQGYKVIKAPLIAAAAALYPAILFFGTGGLTAVVLLCFVTGGIIYVLRDDITFKDFLATVASLAYPLIFLSAGYLLNHAGGSFLLLFALLIALITDTGAYFVGRTANAITKNTAKKLIPRVSPKKTVAGAIGGVVVCAAVIILYWYLIEYGGGVIDLGYKLQDVISVSDAWVLPAYILIALAASVISQLGDLFASRIKRECGIKDFGNLIPGHGGVIDRVDAVMFVIAAVYAVTVIF